MHTCIFTYVYIQTSCAVVSLSFEIVQNEVCTGIYMYIVNLMKVQIQYDTLECNWTC